MTSLADAPDGINLNESKVPALVSGFAVTWGFAVISVVLRVLARRLVKNHLWWDDWLIVASLVFSGAFLFDITCYMIPKGGFGKHIWVAPENGFMVYFEGLFIAEYTYTASIVLIKFSVLAFYWRLFNAARSTGIMIWILAAIVAAWGIAVLLVTTFQCLPVSAFWRQFDVNNPMDPSDFKCKVDVRNFFIGNAIPNIMTDILMLLIPLPGIWRLQLRKPQKLALLGIFLVGLFVTAVSVIRLYYVLALDFSNIDVTWLFSEEMMWTGIETNVATVCACLPSLKPILNLLMHGSPTGTSQQVSSMTNSRSAAVVSTAHRRDGGVRLSSHTDGNSTTHIAPRRRDQHPFSTLEDNDSDTWVDTGRDVEMDRMDKSDDDRKM